MRRVQPGVWDLWFQRTATLVLVVVALVMGIRQVGAGGALPGGPTSAPLVPEDWRNELETGIRIGPSDAPVAIVEFMDLQCPYCASWWARVDSLVREFPDAVQIAFHHFPLQNHPAALPAAVGAECALQQGRFVEFVSAIFKDQRSLSSRPLTDYAQEAELADLDAFAACSLLPPDSFPRIAYGLELGRRVGVRGTPTVWIDGTSGRPSLDALRSLARPAR